MRKLIVLLLLLLLPASAGDQDFQLFNRTEVDIHALYVSPADAQSWEEDLLGGRQLIAGSDVTIVFAPDTDAQMWDIRVEDAEGNFLEWHDIDLLKASQVILEENGVARIK